MINYDYYLTFHDEEKTLKNRSDKINGRAKNWNELFQKVAEDIQDHSIWERYHISIYATDTDKCHPKPSIADQIEELLEKNYEINDDFSLYDKNGDAVYVENAIKRVLLDNEITIFHIELKTISETNTRVYGVISISWFDEGELYSLTPKWQSYKVR
jgi:hypothetical protein